MSVKCPEPVPYAKQSTPTTCWHAALKMLADYHKYELVTNIGAYIRCLRYMRQLELTPELAKRPPPKAAGITVEETNKLCDKNALNAFQRDSEFTPKDVWAMIESLLARKGPLIALMGVGDGSWVHWIVITETRGKGLDSDTVVYHDPAVGPDQEMTHAQLKAAIVGVMVREPGLVKKK